MFRFIILGIVVCSLSLRADVPISGRVVDESNAAVPGATVNVTPGDRRATTDPTGTFTIGLPNAGRYWIAVEREGFYPVKDQPVDIGETGGEIRLVLNHEREFYQSVAVNAAPSPVDLENTSAERRLSGLQVTDIPYPATRSLRNALLLMPGVISDPAGGLHFEGGAENQTLYTLEGFNISDPLTGKFNSRLSVDAVRSLDYQGGRYSPEFGKGSAGVLAIRTQSGDDVPRYSATNFIPGVDTRSGLHIGTWAPRAGIAGPILRGRAWFADNADGEYSENLAPGLPKGQNRTSTVQGSNLLHTQFNLSPSNILFSNFLINTLNAPQAGLGALDPWPTTTDKRSRLWFFSVKDQIYLGRGTLLEVGFGESRTLARQVPQGRGLYILTPAGRQGNYFVDSTQSARRDQFIANLYPPAFRLRGAHQLKVGSDLNRLDYRQNVTRTGYELRGLSGRVLRGTTFGGNGALSRPSLEAAAYLVDEWRIRPNLVVAAGLRVDWDELVRRINPAPRVAISWSPPGWRDTRISGGYAVVYDATPLQFLARPLDQYSVTTIYNPDGTVLAGPAATYYVISGRLKSPRYQTWSAGIEQRLPWKMQAGISLMRRRGRDGFTYVNPLPAEDIYRVGTYYLTNSRRDSYDSAGIVVRQSLGERHEWMASYIRSRALSNAVVDASIDQPLFVSSNRGPQNWDSPNRFLSWGYLPTPFRNWAVAYLLDARTGFPFSAQRENGAVAGAVNSYRYPPWFDLNLHVERRLRFRHYLFALRGGFNNITNHHNPAVVNNVIGSPQFLQFYATEGRHVVFRVRWLGKG